MRMTLQEAVDQLVDALDRMHVNEDDPRISQRVEVALYDLDEATHGDLVQLALPLAIGHVREAATRARRDDIVRRREAAELAALARSDDGEVADGDR